MSLALFNFGEYTIFVWPAFFFTFIIFFSIYLKTKKELKKVEKIYLSNFPNEYANAKVETTAINNHGKTIIITSTY